VKNRAFRTQGLSIQENNFESYTSLNSQTTHPVNEQYQDHCMTSLKSDLIDGGFPQLGIRNGRYRQTSANFSNRQEVATGGLYVP
jgi:hypothetical protein